MQCFGSAWYVEAGPTVMAAGAEGLTVFPDNAPRFPGPVGRESDVFGLLATRNRPAAPSAVWVTAAPQSGPGVHIHRGEDEFFYVLKGGFRFKWVTAWSAALSGPPFPATGHGRSFRTSARSRGTGWAAGCQAVLDGPLMETSGAHAQKLTSWDRNT